MKRANIMTLFNISKNSENSHLYDKSHEFRAKKNLFYKENPLILYLNLFCKVPAAHQCPNSQEPNLCYCSICGLRNMFVSRHKAVLEQTNLNWNANIYFKPINLSFHGHFTLDYFWRIYLTISFPGITSFPKLLIGPLLPSCYLFPLLRRKCQQLVKVS